MRLLPMMLAAALAAPALADAPAAPPPAPTTLTQSSSFIGTALNVVDLDREIAFYTQALGLKVAATLPGPTRSETILQFPGNPAQGSILLMHDTTPDAPIALTHGNDFSRLVIRVVDLAALAVRLTQLGYAHGEVRAGGQGYHVLMMSDPEGYRLELVQPGPPRTGS
jgi:catechol 2,3-dioxygenase-like lactoylglutathione lyase family enzyme